MNNQFRLIRTVLAVGIPQKETAIAFLVTHPLAAFAEQTRIRNRVTDLINDAHG